MSESKAITKVILDLETNPDLDPDERHRYANIVRDYIDALERKIEASAARGAREVEKVFAPPGPRERSVLVWSRGTSVSIRLDGPEEAQWLEELASDCPQAIRFRLEPQSAKRVEANVEHAWMRGLRAHVLPVRVPRVAEGEAARPMDERVLEAVRAVSEAGDWVLYGPRRRNVGGHKGDSLIVTFSRTRLEPWGEMNPETETTAMKDEEVPDEMRARLQADVATAIKPFEGKMFTAPMRKRLRATVQLTLNNLRVREKLKVPSVVVMIHPSLGSLRFVVGASAAMIAEAVAAGWEVE